MVATDRQHQAAQRLVTSNRAESWRTPTVEPVIAGVGRRITATGLLCLASPASALPIVVACVIFGGLIGTAAGHPVRYGLLFAALVIGPLSWMLVRWAARNHLRTDGHRRWLPLVTAVAAAGLTTAELVTGGRLDLVVLLWIPVGVASTIAILARLRLRWSMLTRVLLCVAPICVAWVSVVRLTNGFFDYRFAHTVAALDREAVLHGLEARGDVGWFTIDTQRSVVGCDVGYRISGWWVDDSRTVVRCPTGPPAAILEPRHLSGDWYWIRLER